VVASAALCVCSPAPLRAAVFHRSATRATTGSNITLRKRVHVNTLITEPGTVEIDWAGLYSLSTTRFAMPAAIKYTPPGHSILWGRTEYSVAFDSISNADYGGGRVTQFSDSATLTATSVLFDGEKLDIAIAPQATVFLRGESGVRLGAIAIARYDAGRNSMGLTASWSVATHSTGTNPAGTFDLGFGFGRRLAASGTLGKFTPHMNVVREKSTAIISINSVFEGVEFQATNRVAFDVSGQHFALRSAAPDNQLVFAMTINLGKLN
jgi:hypothetical protein